MSVFNKYKLYGTPVFRSSLIRLGVWGFAVIYVYVGALLGRYPVNRDSFTVLVVFYLLFFAGIFISVSLRPVWEERRYVSLLADISATAFCIYLTGEASSPFFILYIWIFVSYGTRYGRLYLNAASILSVLAYSTVVTILDQWGEYFFEASFVLLALGLLPIYQHSLISQLHLARHEAERSNLMVGKFLSNMTNEMRSPLGDIVTTSKELTSSELNMWQLDRIDEINSSASILDSVIGDVLDFYKLEAGKLQIQSVLFEVRALMDEVCSSALRPALMRHIELVCSVASDVPKIIVADEQRLKQVLTNIIKSSIDGCLSDELCVSVQLDSLMQGMLLFSVRGVVSAYVAEKPVSETESPVAVDDAVVTSEVSPDLGDRFAGKLITLMGGKYGVESGDGDTVFWFALPALTDDFESSHDSVSSVLQGKKAFVFEPNATSRDVIVNCCTDQDMMVEAMDKVSELSTRASRIDQDGDVDVILIADSPRGRNVARIAGICMDIFGKELPLVVLAYRRSCMDLSGFSRVALIRKPFVQDQLIHAMKSVMASEE